MPERTLSEKKTGLYGENLVQTHYLMSIYQIIFGMPCVGVRRRFCAGNGNRSTLLITITQWHKLNASTLMLSWQSWCFRDKIYCQICAARQNNLMKSWSKLFVLFFSCNVLLIICNTAITCENVKHGLENICWREISIHIKRYTDTVQQPHLLVCLWQLLGDLLFMVKSKYCLFGFYLD